MDSRPDSLSAVAAGREPGSAELFSPWLRSAAAIWLLLVVVVGESVRGRLKDPDLWWHLRTGEWIAAHHAVPTTDPFSYSAAGQPWVAHEWLSEMIFWGVFRAWGYGGLVWFRAAILVGIVTLMYFVLRARSGSFIVAIMLAVAVVLGTKSFWSERPHLFTFLLLALTLWLLELAFRGRRRALWVIPPLVILWANLHGGYAGALVLLGAVLAGLWLDIRLRRYEDAGASRLVAGLAAVLGLSLLAAMVNPHGPSLLLYPFRYMTEQGLTQFVSEWAAPSVKEPIGRLLEVLLLSTAVLGMAWRFHWPWRDVLPFLVFAHLALTAVRHVPIFALVAACLLASAWPVLAPRVQERVTALRPGRRLLEQLAEERAKPGAGNDTPGTRLISLAIVASGLVLCLAVAPRNNTFAGMVKASDVPATAAAAWLREHVPPGRIFNDYDFGGYLIYALPPPWQVLIDGRADLYGGAMVRDYIRQAVNAGPEWREWLDGRYRADTVFWTEKLPLTQVLLARPDEWELVYRRGGVVIFRRRAAVRQSSRL